MSIKSKRKIRNWGSQSHWMGRLENSLPDNKNENDEFALSIKSMITGEYMEKRDVLRAWQEFVFTRQDKVNKKIEFDRASSEHTKLMKQVDELLKGQAEEVNNKVTELVLSATYMHYNKGFFDGMKIATIMGNL